MIDHTGVQVSDPVLSRAFYDSALAPLGYKMMVQIPPEHTGGRSNGGPGPRPHYHKDYYGAFVLDPDGHNIEAACHEPRQPIVPTNHANAAARRRAAVS